MSSSPAQIRSKIQTLVRDDWGRILAILTKNTGDLQLAEDCLQEAVVAAMSNWEKSGIPSSPTAWLVRTAKNKAVDSLRRDKNFQLKEKQISMLMEMNQSGGEHMEQDAIPDERLRMIFTCCHPALNEKTRVALTLRTLGGLTTQEIANAFLDEEKAMGQRLFRAKQKIKIAKIPYEIPEPEEWPDRLGAALSVIYLIFNEGYKASSGQQTIRHDLCDEAIRLARIMHSLLPDETEVCGLLALMLLHHSRTSARYSNGKLIMLDKQNRTMWNRSMISEGVALITKTLQLSKIGTYQIQAAISALHCEGESYESTDWAQIVSLYGELYKIQPTRIVKLNQLIAFSYSDGAAAALNWIHKEKLNENLQKYQPFLAAMADLHRRDGNRSKSGDYYRQALELTKNEQEKIFLQARLNSLLN